MSRQLSILSKMGDALAGRIDTIGHSKGDVVVRRGFFYTNGTHAEVFGAGVMEALKAADIRGYSNEPLTFELIEANQVWKSFRGSATVAQGSHWNARIKVIFPTEA